MPQDQVKLMQEGKPFAIPSSLSICQDQGSIGFSAMWFLVYELQGCIHPMIDPLHRVSNDCKLALGACKLKPHVWISTVVMNMVFGPWESATFWCDILDGWKEYLSHAGGPQDPLFQELLPLILDDLRMADPGLSDAALGLQAWQKLQDGEGFSKKGNKVNLTRWFAWNAVAMEFDKVWNLRLVVQAFMGLRLGWLAKENKAFQMSVANPAAEPGGDARDTTNIKKADAASKLREQCKNTMHMSTAWLLDRCNQLRSRMVFTLQQPLWDWYASTNSDLRDPANCLPFHVDNA
eukprot:16026903-Heterocapsa_arctica.AAC.1